MPYSISPLRAFVGGLAAGALGSLVQSLFFKATTRYVPSQPEGAFTPPEAEQKNEMATTTVARRLVEGMMQRELGDTAKARSGNIVHIVYGSLWGGLYGLMAESHALWRKPLGMVGYGTLVWGLSDNLILPAFRLSAWPQAYPFKNHFYAWTAHVAYSAGLWGSYEAIQRVPWKTAVRLILLRRAIMSAQKRLLGVARRPVAWVPKSAVRRRLHRIATQIRA